MATLNTRLACACAAALICSLAPVVHATQSQALTLRDALELASAHNPELAGFRPQTEALRQQAAVDALALPVTLEAQLENFAGTGNLSSARALESTLQLSRAIELGGKATLRRRVGDMSLERLDAVQRARRADILAEVARRFVHVLSDQAQLAATYRATKLAEQARNVVQERIAAGAASPVFLSRAEIALARTKIEQEHAEHELATSRVALASLWGDRQATFGDARGELFDFPPLEPLEAYEERLANNPDLLRFASEERLLDARARLAQAHRRPTITLSAGVRRLENFDDQAFVAGFSIPLGSRKRAHGEIRALGAEREQLGFAATSHRLELHVTLFGLYQEVQHRRFEAEALQDEIRPQAERMVRVSEQGYRAGRFSLLELADAQSQLLDIERDAIRAAAEFHSQLIDIERLTGVPVRSLASRPSP